MRRNITRASQIAIDLAVLAFALTLAFIIRFEGLPPLDMMRRLILLAPYVVAAEYVVLWTFGVPRYVWRYTGLKEVANIFVAMLTAAMVLVLVRVVVGDLVGRAAYLRNGVLPYGVIAINFTLAFLGVTGVRIARRMLGEHKDSERRRVERRASGSPALRTLLVGAGQAGVIVARELGGRPDLNVEPIGFVDDDRTKVGSVVHGIPILGTTAQIPELSREHGAQQVLITIASAPGTEIRRITRLCEEAGLPPKIIPGIYEIVGGKVNLSRIRDIAIDDLLRREPVVLDMAAISADLRGKVVLVTGAGGSIGSEICRQVCRFTPAALVLVERCENNLFHIHRELAQSHREVKLIPCIADVTDVPRMEAIFKAHKPNVVFHAAAHKHVPMMEWNPAEAIKNNVFGTRRIADLAHDSGADVFVMISTDKAVNPTSVMGASKRVAEIYVQALSQRSKTRFVTVRFGNVLGSAGSVIPIFQEQIAKGGPITVTHPDMRRYFMTIPEACQLVLQAGSMGKGGEIFVLDMGEPVKIVDLARDLIALSGLREGDDIEIQFSGVRPGEKLFEELSTDAEHADKTRHEKIFVGRIERQSLDRVSEYMEWLGHAAERADAPHVVETLLKVVPEYTPDEAYVEKRGSQPSVKPNTERQLVH